MREHLRRRFYLETASAVVSAVLLVATLISKEWIEFVVRFDPDNHSGSLEWSIVGVMVAVTVTSTLLARVEWKRGLATA